MIALNVNGRTTEVDVAPDTPLLWVLRDHLDLTGTKFGCGVAVCGACTVHLDGAAVRSCVMPAAACVGKRITTIEGLAMRGELHPVQRAWIEHQVPQCGYCQSGIIMAAAALLSAKPRPTERDVAEGITNICRCGTYPRVNKAIRALAESKPGRG